ncbi:iron chelate uptake ABC transporter family permease subunit [Allokutzneria sp. A3M-2-11 16]|uniref:FecCD family ABC transporter permease n=1 Tax=Allokutzneria sp. A3M-2-11 16 TaxID=2962043 RepID=UPI0020B6AFF3|nr:iron chelate uptake ABC transporter family permease subunit [Allokutzneria sp. A3M-2-11 16]MCP3804747.1 iron chelate uptake ABC transporter family permease subunit [Allokutzneria sp. A3M-2-11 16]
MTARPRTIVACFLLGASAFLLLCLEITIGDFPLTVPEVAAGLFGSGDPAALLVINEIRLPRALVGLLIGIAFGVGGLLFQALARNPLASPDVIGVTDGANTFAVATLLAGAGTGLGMSTMAVLGGFTVSAIVVGLSWKQGTTGIRIVLVGIGMAALCGSITDYLLLKSGAFQAQQAVVWLTGSLSGRTWGSVPALAVAVALLVPAALALGKWLAGLELGEDTARGLGVPVQGARLAIMAVGVGLVSFATAAAGPVAFVALLAPQIARRLVHPSVPPLMTSGLVGAVVVLAADLVARTLLSSGELPVGVVTGVVGAPVLLWLLARSFR